MGAARREPFAPLKVTTGSLVYAAPGATAKASKRLRHSGVAAD
jgi:hypothetical protein